jgi:NTP pyrophosphatase (non-canonical NTP hydrolase)
MDYGMYQKHAKRTMNEELGPQMQLASMALGITGELGELVEIFLDPHDDDTHHDLVKNELGDVCFYTANLCTILSLDWTSLFEFEDAMEQENASRAFLRTIQYGAAIADTVKKTVAQGHVLNIDKILENLKMLAKSLVVIADFYGMSLYEVLEYNHLKVRKRYPDGFKPEHSINRT